MRKRINWSALLGDLGCAQLTQKEIAAKVVSSQPAISRLAKGDTEDPPHSVGDALLVLHRATCGEEKHLELLATAPAANEAAPPPPDGRDPNRTSAYAGSDIDRRAPGVPALEGGN